MTADMENHYRIDKIVIETRAEILQNWKVKAI